MPGNLRAQVAKKLAKDYLLKCVAAPPGDPPRDGADLCERAQVRATGFRPHNRHVDDVMRGQLVREGLALPDFRWYIASAASPPPAASTEAIPPSNAAVKPDRTAGDSTSAGTSAEREGIKP